MEPVGVHNPVAGSYNSAEEREREAAPPHPPAVRTLPSGRRVNVAPWRAVFIDPVVVHNPVSGSYTSAEERVTEPSTVVPPPATRTFPSGRSVANGKWRAVPIEPVADHNPVAGSYSSAEERTPVFPDPPAMRTLPFGRSVAVCQERVVPIEPVAVHVPVAGSYDSAEERDPVSVMSVAPPAMRTVPFGRSVAVCA